MSIYFQYPPISDYPNHIYPTPNLEVSVEIIKNEDSINREEIAELKDFLALKPV